MEFNLMQRVLTVVHAPDALDAVLEAVRSLDRVYTPIVFAAALLVAVVPPLRMDCASVAAILARPAPPPSGWLLPR
jgi:Cd2+/Zn2+-exporting ATPase